MYSDWPFLDTNLETLSRRLQRSFLPLVVGMVTFAGAIVVHAAEPAVEPGGVGIRDEALLEMARQAGATAIEENEPEIGIGHYVIQLSGRRLLLTNDRMDGFVQLRFSWRTQREIGEDDLLRINMWNQEPGVGRATLLELPLQGEVHTIWVLEDEFEFQPNVPRAAPVEFIKRFGYLAQRFDDYVKGNLEAVPTLDDKPGDRIPVRYPGLEPPVETVETGAPGTDREKPQRITSALDGPLSAVAAPAGASLAMIAAKLGDRELLTRSLELLEQAVDRNPNDVRVATQLADAYVATGRELAITQAIQVYRSQLKDNPNAGPLLSRIADAYQQLGNVDDALDYAARRARLPDAQDRYAGTLQVALISIEADQSVRGLEVAEPIYVTHPDDNVVALIVATLMFESKHDHDARKLLAGLIDRLPDDHIVSINARSMLARRERD
ncbi:MAG: hypothetical protein HQ518_23545 [Rhodopirellula sp.]|nr:hypothetical protein [Rhodopirellula sp.]